MKILHLSFSFTVIMLLLQTVMSCSPEAVEKNERTREIELKELDSLLTVMEERGDIINSTQRGIYYIVKKEGTGPVPQEGDTCSVEFLGFYNNIQIDDTENSPNKTWTFPYRYSKTVHPVLGLLDGIGYMNKGAEFEMYIPSDFAHGSKGLNEIPPYSTVYYKVTMKNLRPKVPGPK